MTKDKQISVRIRSAFLLMIGSVLASTAIAQGFSQASSASELRAASGTVHDVTEFDAAPHWVIDGDWVLQCRGAPCAEIALDAIVFDLALTMVRPDGAGSHTHNFSDFVATSVIVVGDDLVIDGTITGSGAVGFTDVTVTLSDVADSAGFFVELTGNGHLSDPLGGVIVQSR